MNRQPLNMIVLQIDYRVFATDHSCYCENTPEARNKASQAIMDLSSTGYVTNIGLEAVDPITFDECHYSKITAFVNDAKKLEDEEE